MQERVTDFAIDTFDIPEDAFYDLPPKARELIRAYAVPKRSTRPDTLRFEIAAYRWDEINTAIASAAIKGAHDGDV